MKVTIFDVGHGGCALLEADTGAKALIDCGRNTDTGWRPSEYLKERGITQLEALFVTNYDEDHVRDIANVLDTVYVKTLWRNKGVTPEQIHHLKSDTGMGSGIETLCDMMRTYCHPIEGYGADWGDIQFKTYKHNYPTFDDENNLSFLVFVEHPNLKILFPGDMEKEGWEEMLKNPAFVADLQTTDILVASHHGRDNGCSANLFKLTGWNPSLVIVSDNEIIHGTQETTTQWYRERSHGMTVGGENRHVLTTRKDGTVYLAVTSAGFSVETATIRNKNKELLAALGASLFQAEKAASAGLTAAPNTTLLGALGNPPSTSFSIPASTLFGLGTKK